jgi:hypothetical protein
VAESPAPLAEVVVGTWFTTNGDIGIGLVLGASGHHISLASMSVTVPVSATEVRDGYANWSGDGTYVSIANLLAFFPASRTTPAQSHLVRLYEESNSAAPSGWITRLCQIKRGTTGSLDPYEICLNQQD